MQARRTEYKNESPCAVTDEEEDDGCAAPATAERNQKLDECKDKKDGFKCNEGGPGKNQGENSGNQEDMCIREDDEGRWGTYHGAGCVKTYAGDNDYKSDDHGEILQEKKNDKWDGDGEIAIVEGMYFKEMNIRRDPG